MSEEIIIKHALKKYGDNVIIPDLSLDIREGEFFTLLGPSGCGKTYLETLSGYRAEIHTVRPEQQKNQDITMSVRPEEFLLDRDSTEGISAIVDDCVFLGLNTHYFVHLSSGEEVEIIQESSIDSIIEPGSEIKLKINTDKVNLFTADGEENILTGVCNDCAKA